MIRNLFRWAFAVALLAASCLPLSVFAAFEDTGTGARPAALGNAYTALGDDVLSLYYNPAGLARLREAEAATEYSRLYAGLSDGSNISQYMLSGGMPAFSGTIGFGWKQLNLSGLYQERTLTLGYGRWLGLKFALGGSIKQLYHGFTAPSTTVDDNGNITAGTPSLFTQKGTGKSAYAADLGALYRLGRLQWLGLSILNVNAPNVALDSSVSDHVARTWRLGWAYQDMHRLSVTSEYECEQSPGGPTDQSATAGAEKGWDFGSIGATFVRGALTLGSRNLRRVSTGFGMAVDGLRLDYAFVLDMAGVSIGSTAGTHRISLSYRFSEPSLAHGAQNPVPSPVDRTSPSIINVPDKNLDPLSQDAPENQP